MNCPDCGGFVGEPFKAYGYAGKWCYCPNPKKYIYKTYSTSKTFETEGDMYEYLTWHRSEVLDKGGYKCPS